MKIAAIAINTFREAVRDKILYTLLFFAIAMIASSILLGKLVIGDQTKIIKDMGLASISLFGVLIAIFVGIGLVFKEIERKTIYTIIAKPIQRYQFLLGKYLGLILTLVVEVVIMSTGFILLLFYYEPSPDMDILKAILLIFFELMLITSIALLFSSFSTPIMSGVFTLSMYVIGHLTGDLKMLGSKSESAAVKHITEFMYYLLPNLENFNIKAKVVHNIPVSWGYILYAMSYGILYIAIILLISAIIFQRRDFK